MPDSLRLTDGGYLRRPDVQSIIHYLYNMQCVAILGFSNIGKSALLRLLAQTDVWVQELGEAGREFLPVYIDCNRMLEMSDHGFYELVLRCLQESHEALAALPERQREAIVLCHHQGLGNIEAAGLMTISVEALESLLGRGRRALKASLADLRGQGR